MVEKIDLSLQEEESKRVALARDCHKEEKAGTASLVESKKAKVSPPNITFELTTFLPIYIHLEF